MKKLIAVCLLLMFTFSLCSCGKNTAEAVIDYGNSEIFSEKEIASAIAEIQKTFETFDGCELHSLTYAGDEVCRENVLYLQQLSEDPDLTESECMVFFSSFRSPKNGGGAWNADTEYTWDWFLAKDQSGNWELLTYGC